MAEFEEKFDVEEATAKDYKVFIEKMRALLRVDSLSPNLGNLPVLPPQAPNDELPTRFFDIVLQTSNRSLRMRIRRDNLYAVGYQMPDSGQWYEFGIPTQSPPPPQLIPNSIFLGFNGTYEEEFLLSLRLGQQQLINAVSRLSNPNQQGVDRKRQLMILIQMICESIRFRDISDHLFDTFYDGGVAPTNRMLDLEHIWGDISRALRDANADPNNAFTIPPNRLNIVNAAMAVPLLGIVLHVCMNRGASFIKFRDISDHLVNTLYVGGSPPPAPQMLDQYTLGDLSRALQNAIDDPNHEFQISPNILNIVVASQAVAVLGTSLLQVSMNRGGASSRFSRIAVMDEEVCSGGRPLVEVYSVRILNIDNENPGDLYGKITVSDGLNSQYIFNRSRDNIQSIRPREFALLTGPARSVSAYGGFTIDMDLWDRDTDLSPDDEISKGTIIWEVSNTYNVYDDPIYDDVPGQYGSAQVNYIVLSDAVQGTVEVTLINGDDENPADVYGLLAARNSNFTNESVLFQRSSGEYIDVNPGNLIPLSRSVVAVPLNSSLIVRADLWDYDTIGSNDEIAVGTADFPAKLSGTFEKPIYGKYGEIRVKVTWT